MVNKPNLKHGYRQSSHLRRQTAHNGNPISNAILGRIPDHEYALIATHLEFTRTQDHEVLYEAGERLEYAYFPNRGLICVVTEISDGRTLEVGVVSKGGYLGESNTVGPGTCTHKLVAQPAIDGFRIQAEVLQSILPETPDLRLRLGLYSRFQCMRTSQIAACNRFHEIEQRLARWLLMSQDRVGSAILPFTHEFLAGMLGTGRATVTLAAGILQKAGMIGYHRGAVKIVNRKLLERAVCECYGAIRQVELTIS